MGYGRDYCWHGWGKIKDGLLGGKHWSWSCSDEWGESGGDAAQVEWNNVKKPRGPKSRTVTGEGWMH